jgi:hypothetical protein
MTHKPTLRKPEVIRHRTGSVFEMGGDDADSPFFIQVFLDRYASGYEGQGDFKLGPLTVSLSFYGNPLRPTIEVGL